MTAFFAESANYLGRNGLLLTVLPDSYLQTLKEEDLPSHVHGCPGFRRKQAACLDSFLISWPLSFFTITKIGLNPDKSIIPHSWVCQFTRTVISGLEHCWMFNFLHFKKRRHRYPVKCYNLITHPQSAWRASVEGNTELLQPLSSRVTTVPKIQTEMKGVTMIDSKPCLKFKPIPISD